MYFENCNDLNELKAAYKKLALENHPDMGGDVRVMQEINAEYDRMFLLLKAKQNTMANDDPTGRTRRTTEAPEEFRAVVDTLLKLAGIEVELCGAWLWISGDTYAHREALKACGCLWSRSKQKWYWRHLSVTSKIGPQKRHFRPLFVRNRKRFAAPEFATERVRQIRQFSPQNVRNRKSPARPPQAWRPHCNVLAAANIRALPVHGFSKANISRALHRNVFALANIWPHPYRHR